MRPRSPQGILYRKPAAAGGGGGAPVDAQYLTLALDGTLTAERRFVPAGGLSAVDGGAGGDYTLTGIQTGRSGSWPLAGMSLGTSYTTEIGFVCLALRNNFPMARAYTMGGGAPSPQYGWNCANFGNLTSLDENTTTANCRHWKLAAVATDWGGVTFTAPLVYRTFNLIPGRPFRSVAAYAAGNADETVEVIQLAIMDATSLGTCFRVGPGYRLGRVVLAIGPSGFTSNAITAAQLAAGIMVSIEGELSVSGTLSLQAAYSTTVSWPPPAPSAMTAAYSTSMGLTRRAVRIGTICTATVNSGTLEADEQYFEPFDRSIESYRHLVPCEELTGLWGATQYDATSPTQYCGYVDLGSDAPTIDLAALRLELASRVNIRPGDAATVEWSLVRDAATPAPGASSWNAAAAVVVDAAGRYLHLYCRIVSTGSTQGSIWWGDSPTVRAS